MKVIIAGAYAIGNYLASLLNRTNEEITIIDTDEEALASINPDLDVLTFKGLGDLFLSLINNSIIQAKG